MIRVTSGGSRAGTAAAKVMQVVGFSSLPITFPAPVTAPGYFRFPSPAAWKFSRGIITKFFGHAGGANFFLRESS